MVDKWSMSFVRLVEKLREAQNKSLLACIVVIASIPSACTLHCLNISLP
jgi:hypothetical protein